MDNIFLPSTRLPGIEITTKKMVNLGIWHLYRVVRNRDLKATFILIAGNNHYLLNSKGRVITTHSNDQKNAEICQTVYFSDLPQPQSVSNFQMA
jgi:hypothetical protein